MIVVDANVVAYAVLPGEKTPLALAALAKDPEWVAPTLWQSEIRNVLAVTMRVKGLGLDVALGAWAQARRLVIDGPPMDAGRVLGLAARTKASAHDCEYAAVAEALGVSFVTSDTRLARRFPDRATPLGAFVKQD